MQFLSRQAVVGYRHIDQMCGQLLSIGCAPPTTIVYNATSPGVYGLIDPASLTYKEFRFVDKLKIDYASPLPTIDTDGFTPLGELKNIARPHVLCGRGFAVCFYSRAR